MHFCRRSERLYTRKLSLPTCTCMHTCVNVYKIMVHHMCFGWRYNGILENLPNNNRSIHQLMKRFVENTHTIPIPDDFTEFSSFFKEKRTVGTLLESQTDLSSHLNTSWLFDRLLYEIPKCSQLAVFTESDIEELKQLYSKQLSTPVSAIKAPYSYIKDQHVSINGKIVGSHKSWSSSSSILMAQSFDGSPVTLLLFHAFWFKPHWEMESLLLYGSMMCLKTPIAYCPSNS